MNRLAPVGGSPTSRLEHRCGHIKTDSEAYGDWLPSRPVLCARARPRGSIREATMLSAMMMITDLLAVLLALRLASLFRFYSFTAGWKAELSSAPWTTLSPGYFLVFAAALLMVHHRYGAVCSGEESGSLTMNTV